MRSLFHILLYSALVLSTVSSAQLQPFRESKKWGLKNHDQPVIEAKYDTIYGYDSTGKVCLACYKVKSVNNNSVMKVTSTSFFCNYYNANGEVLHIRNKKGDTCSVFSLAKNSVKQYYNSAPHFVVMVRNKKYLLTKDFVQLTFKGYNEISISNEPYFYVTQNADEFDVVYTGLINQKEEQVIPYQYSQIKVNPEDSLIIACSAGLRPNAEDEVFDYSGKRYESSRRHIDMATKNFLIHKIFEPKEYYVLYNVKTKQEKELQADELVFYQDDEVLIKIKNEWFIYDLNTNQKKIKSKS